MVTDNMRFVIIMYFLDGAVAYTITCTASVEVHRLYTHAHTYTWYSCLLLHPS